MFSLCPLEREVSRRRPVLTGGGSVPLIESGISSSPSLSRQICGSAQWSSLYASFGVSSGGEVDGGADTHSVNQTWGCLGWETITKGDGDWKWFFPVAIKGRAAESEAALEPCAVVVDGAWNPGDPFLLSHVVDVIEGVVQGGQPLDLAVVRGSVCGCGAGNDGGWDINAGISGGDDVSKEVVAARATSLAPMEFGLDWARFGSVRVSIEWALTDAAGRRPLI